MFIYILLFSRATAAMFFDRRGDPRSPMVLTNNDFIFGLVFFTYGKLLSACTSYLIFSTPQSPKIEKSPNPDSKENRRAYHSDNKLCFSI